MISSLDINIQYSSARSLGPLFHSNINSPEGWFAHECLVPGAELSLIDEQGRDAAGKVIPTSVMITFLIKLCCRG